MRDGGTGPRPRLAARELASLWSAVSPGSRLERPGDGLGKLARWLAVLLLAAGPVLLGSGGPLEVEPAAAASIGVGVDGMTIDFGPVSPKDGPRVISRAVQLVVESDGPWQMTVAAASDLVNDDPAVPPLPAARLEWALDAPGGPKWRPLATEPAVVAAGPGGPAPSLVALSLRLTVGWDDPPAATPYRTTLVYTASPGATLAASFARALPGAPGDPVRYAIGYWVPGDGPVPVRVHLARETGETVRTAVLTQTGGRWHTWEWDGRDDAGRPLPPGSYYYTVVGPDGRVLAAGLCYPPEAAYPPAGAFQVRMLSSSAAEEPRLRLETAADPGQVAGGDWLRLDWTLTNPGSRAVAGVVLDVELPAGWQPMGGAGSGDAAGGAFTAAARGSDGHAAGGRARWTAPVGTLAPGESRTGHLWVAVAPGTPAGTHRLSFQARSVASGRPLSDAVSVPVAVVTGSFDAGRLVARVVWPGSPGGSGAAGEPAGRSGPAGVGLRVLGGPRLRTAPTESPPGPDPRGFTS